MLTQALVAAANTGDANAAQYLKTQEETAFATFLPQLCVELGSKDRPLNARELAGLTIKNAIDARSDATAAMLQNRWKTLPAQTRSQIKGMLLQILHDEAKPVRHTAARVSTTNTHLPALLLFLSSPSSFVCVDE